jgi:hypothetical protein
MPRSESIGAAGRRRGLSLLGTDVRELDWLCGLVGVN